MASNNLINAAKMLQKVKENRTRNALSFLEMNKPQAAFVLCRNSQGITPRRRLMECGNKVGKTHIGLAEDIAHGLGVRPWIKKGGKGRKINIRLPNKGLIGCETLIHSVPNKIEPLLRYFIPEVCMPYYKNAPSTGVLQKVVLRRDLDGNQLDSVISIRSYDSDARSFEGLDYDWIHWDEPPPYPIFTAVERGKVVSDAPSWFTMTPVREPWVHTELSSKAGVDPEIAVIRGSIWDNCVKNGGYLTEKAILEFLKTLDEEEREAREFGVWKHLAGLVYKEFSRDTHLYEDFMIPPKWTKIEAVDPHDARPTRWLFGAVSPEEVIISGKKAYRIYFYDYLLLGGVDIGTLVREVKAKRAFHEYDNPSFVVIDRKFAHKEQHSPLYGSFAARSWEKELKAAGIKNVRLSHSSPGDVELGHKIVREYLLPQFSTLYDGARPGILFARKGCGAKKVDSPIYDLERYIYQTPKDKKTKNPTGKANEISKDFPDAIRYACMEKPQYIPPDAAKMATKRAMEGYQAAIESRRLM